MLQTALRFSHTLLKEIISAGDTVVDATMGNGNDTLFLAQLVGEKGQVYAFDIQPQALHNSQQKLTDHHLLNRVKLFQTGHENLGVHLGKEENIQAAIFNLGYLPKSDKSIVTRPHTTKQALNELLDHLAVGGRIVLVAYYGHAGGQEELEAIHEFCQKLPQNQFTVLDYHFINQKNQPPILFCIEKISDEAD